MKFFCSLLIAGSMSAFAQETPAPTVPTQDKAVAQHAGKSEHPHKAHKKNKKHHSKKRH